MFPVVPESFFIVLKIRWHYIESSIDGGETISVTFWYKVRTHLHKENKFRLRSRDEKFQSFNGNQTFHVFVVKT